MRHIDKLEHGGLQQCGDGERATVIPLETRVDRLWREYVEARATATASHDIADGIACGRAFRYFLEEFLGPAEYAGMVRDRDARSGQR